MLSSLSPARKRFVLVVATVVAFAVAAAIVLSTRGGPPAAAPVPQDALGPVILVPGYGGSTTGLEALGAKVRSAGRTAVVMRLPGGGTGDLRAQAKELATLARQQIARTNAPSVDVVGYSAGGVVARLWVRDYGGAAVARRIVTLASPQHGTELAALAGGVLPGACPVACQQLQSGSDLLAGLNSGDETPTGPTFVSLYTTHDDVVVPPESAELDGALNISIQGVCTNSVVNHSQLPTDPVVQAMVVSELAAGPPVALTGADCPRLSS